MTEKPVELFKEQAADPCAAGRLRASGCFETGVSSRLHSNYCGIGLVPLFPP